MSEFHDISAKTKIANSLAYVFEHKGSEMEAAKQPTRFRVKQKLTLKKLNVFSRSHLFVDLLNPLHVYRPSSIDVLHYLIIISNLLRFSYFAIGKRTEYETFLLGNRYDFIGGTRFWSTAVSLMDVIYLLSHFVTYKARKDSGYVDLIQKPITNTIAKDRSTLSKILFIANFGLLFGIIDGLFMDAIIVVIISVEQDMSTLEFLYSQFWSYQMALFPLI